MRSASRRLLCIIDHQRPGMRVFSPTCVAIVASLCVRRCGGESSLLSPLWQAASPFLPAWSLPVFVFDPFPFLSDRLLMHYKLLRLQKLWKNMKRGGGNCWGGGGRGGWWHNHQLFLRFSPPLLFSPPSPPPYLTVKTEERLVCIFLENKKRERASEQENRIAKDDPQSFLKMINYF